jgi:acyl carrier protein
VDKRKLSSVAQTTLTPASEYVAPRTETEEKLAEIWAALFKFERVGIHDNFQDLGGHSLLAFQLVSRLRDVFQLELPLSSVFESPTISELAILITHKLTEQREQEEVNKILAEIEQMAPVEVHRLLNNP